MTPSTTDMSVLEAIVASAPKAAARPQSLETMSPQELDAEAKRVALARKEIEAMPSKTDKERQSRAGKLAANTSRIKAIVQEAQDRLEKQAEASKATPAPKAS
jgi:hypothetical protein